MYIEAGIEIEEFKVMLVPQVWLRDAEHRNGLRRDENVKFMSSQAAGDIRGIKSLLFVSFEPI